MRGAGSWIPRARQLLHWALEEASEYEIDRLIREALALMTRASAVKRAKTRVTVHEVTDAMRSRIWSMARSGLTNSDIAADVFGDACADGRVSEVLQGQR